MGMLAKLGLYLSIVKASGPYSQHFIFFFTYEHFQQARVLDYTRPEKLASKKRSDLLGPLITYEENKAL